MKPVTGDPVILICSGVLLVGILSLIWAIAKFRRLLKAEPPAKAPYDGVLSTAPDLRGLDLEVAPIRSSPLPSPLPAGPAATVSKDVSDRLDGMTQRLAEMQMLLAKQATSDPSAQASSLGQGFSPETIDKLLKIIGNVIQQVDILQKNVNLAKEGATPKAEYPSGPETHP